MKKRLAVAAVGLAVFSTALTGCSKQYIDSSMMGLRYAGGIGEGGKFKECLKTGKADYSDDTLYLYPTTQRQDDFNTDRYEPNDPNAADNKDITVTTKDGVQVSIRGNQNFGLNTDCDTIKAFHEQIGKTRKAYFNEDGSYNKGWITTMNYYITPATVEQWRDVISEHNVDELWPSTALYSDLVDTVNSQMQAAVDKRTEGDESYYDRLTFTISSITPTEDYQQQYLQRQQAQTAAETAKLNKDAQVAQAEADKAVRVAQAEAAAAEKHEQIIAYQGPGMSFADAVRAYNEAQAIAAGINPYQPGGTPLIQSGGN
jgi:regulator of protease activity HflC (stomatin/prohibitin superfamily)